MEPIQSMTNCQLCGPLGAHFWLPATSPVNCRLSSHDPSFQPLPSTKIRMNFFHFRNFTSLGFLLSDRTECFVSVSLNSLSSFWFRPRNHVRWNEQLKVPRYYETRFFTKIFFPTCLFPQSTVWHVVMDARFLFGSCYIDDCVSTK